MEKEMSAYSIRELLGVCMLGVLNNYSAEQKGEARKMTEDMLEWMLRDDYYKDIYLENEFKYGKEIAERETLFRTCEKIDHRDGVCKCFNK